MAREKQPARRLVLKYADDFIVEIIKMYKNQNIVVGLSGGVDSSVTAALLKRGGANVRGVFMQNWEDDDNDEYCSIKQDSLDAMAVTDIVGIDIDIVNFAAQYKDKVFAYFLQEYQAGRTPIRQSE